MVAVGGVNEVVYKGGGQVSRDGTRQAKALTILFLPVLYKWKKNKMADKERNKSMVTRKRGQRNQSVIGW
jgi:hypothetical protein